jgi:hypothetical protein
MSAKVPQPPAQDPYPVLDIAAEDFAVPAKLADLVEMHVEICEECTGA